MLTRRLRLMIIGAVMTMLLAATFLLDTPDPTLSIDELMDDPQQRSGDKIAIRGQVTNGSIDNSTLTFTLHGENRELLIDFSAAAVSNGLDDNRTVYAEGELIQKDGKWIFHAEVIKTSCPSKYEEAKS